MVSRAKKLVLVTLGTMLMGVRALASAGGEAEQVDGWNLLNLTEGVTRVSHDIYGLHMMILWICVVIGVVVFSIMFYSMYAHRKSSGREPANFHESTTVELVWTIIPVLLLLVMAFPATTALKELYDTSDADMDIKITAYQWKWQYEYMGEGVEYMSQLSTSQASIYGKAPKSEFYLEEVDKPVVIPVGKKVRFLITAKDVIHSWWVPQLGVKKDAIPGFINETWARVDEPGIYRGRCAELCGKDHAFMPIVVHAVEQEEYDAWLADQKAQVAAQAEITKQQFTYEDLMAQGEESYNRSCASCHGVGGQGIPGAFPALKDSAIALGPVADHLDMVINGSPSNAAMQAFGGQLSEVDIAAIITYERNAWGNVPEADKMVQPVDVYNYKQGQ